MAMGQLNCRIARGYYNDVVVLYYAFLRVYMFFQIVVECIVIIVFVYVYSHVTELLDRHGRL